MKFGMLTSRLTCLISNHSGLVLINPATVFYTFFSGRMTRKPMQSNMDSQLLLRDTERHPDRNSYNGNCESLKSRLG